MAITRDKKEELLNRARDIFSNSKTAVFVHTKGLSAQNTNIMRSEMVQEGVRYAVIKKTLALKALSETTVSGDQPDLEGELSIAYGDDLIAPARLVRTFEKKHKDSVVIMGGIFDGAYMDQGAMSEIANIPDTQVLRGMFVNIINTPIQQLASGLFAIAEKKESAA